MSMQINAGCGIDWAQTDPLRGRMTLLRVAVVCCQMTLIVGTPCWAKTADTMCVSRMLSMVAGVFRASGESLDKEGNLRKFEQQYRVERVGSDVTFYSDDIQVGSWHFGDPDFSFVIYDAKNSTAASPTKFNLECRAVGSTNQLEVIAEWKSDPSGKDDSQWSYRQRQIMSPNLIKTVLQVKSAGSDLPFVITSQYVSTRMAD